MVLRCVGVVAAGALVLLGRIELALLGYWINCPGRHRSKIPSIFGDLLITKSQNTVAPPLSTLGDAAVTPSFHFCDRR